MRILTLSGWGQPHDSLKVIAPDALHVAYGHYTKPDQALSSIAQHAVGADVVIGWSLGAQLALRATLAGLMKPKRLVLIAPPFQFVRNQTRQIGMPRDQFEKFAANYHKNPERTLIKSHELLVMNDKYADHIRRQYFPVQFKPSADSNWQHWLSELEQFSFSVLPHAEIPPTLLIHGKNDVVVGHEHSDYFLDSFPNITRVSLDECGHAPHWHHPEYISEIIKDHCRV